MSLSLVSVSAIREVGGGFLSGAAVAAAVLFFAGRTTDHLVELSFTTIAAYGSFLLAEHFHCSGVLAVLVAGLLIGNLSHRGAITDHGREAVEAFWEFAAFVSNSMIFLLIGIGEGAFGELLVRQLPIIGLAIGASLIARTVSIYGFSFALRGSHAIDMKHQHVLVWGGLKGALALALAIGLPDNMPHRHEVIAAAFGVVAFSVVVQGLTMPLLLKRLGVVKAAS
jgi:CPA1 family monovalent cation:H+ antiporter